jgi:hypothetical protein
MLKPTFMGSNRSWLILAVCGVIAAILPVFIWTALSNLPAWQPLPAETQVLCIGKQSALVAAVFGFKTLYMFLALGILALAWGERSSAWQALQASIMTFWLGEFFCWLNILFYNDESLILEYLHSLFMVFCLGFLSFSLIEAVDKDILHFSDPHTRCAMVGVCKNCVKAQPDFSRDCLLNRLFKWAIPLAALLAFMPLVAQPQNFSFTALVFGYPRSLNHLMPVQWYELRFSSIAALVLMISSWLALTWPSKQPGIHQNNLLVSKVLLSAGGGYLGFSLMRLIFASFYREALVWFVFWEELTELILVVGILVVVLSVRPERVARWSVRLKELFA